MAPHPHMVLPLSYASVVPSIPSSIRQAGPGVAADDMTSGLHDTSITLIICYKVDSLVKSDIRWLPQLADQILCKHLDSRTG